MYKITFLAVALTVGPVQALNAWSPSSQRPVGRCGANGNNECNPSPWYHTGETDAKVEAVRKEIAATKTAITEAQKHSDATLLASDTQLIDMIKNEVVSSRREMAQTIRDIPITLITPDMLNEAKEKALEELAEEWNAQLDSAFIQEMKNIALNELRMEFPKLLEAEGGTQCPK